MLGYILPERLKSLDAFPATARLAWSDAQQTVLYLPLREGAPQAEALCDALRKRAASLLFLRRLRHVSFTDEATGESLHVRRQQQRSESEPLQAKVGQNSTPDGVDRWSVTVEELEYRQDGGSQQQQARRRKYLRCAAELSVPSMFASSASSATTEIVIALPLAEADGSSKDSEDSGEHTEGICQVFCFLPVRNVGLRFALHAEFDLVTNRDDVHDSAWNRWLRDSAARLFVAAVAAQPPVGCAPALAFLPAALRVTEPFWQLFVDGAIRELRVSPLPVMRSESGEFCSLNSLLRRPGCVSERLISNQELKSITGGKQFATGGGKDGAEDALLATLGLPVFGLQELVGCVHAWPTVFAPGWQVELYSALFELLKQAGTGEAGGLEAASRVVRSLRIFPLRNSETVECESGPIFTALQSRDEMALDALGYSLRLLDQPIVDRLQETGAHQARMLLEVLGIRGAQGADLVNLVLREHEELMVGMKPSQALTMARLRAQLSLLQRNADQPLDAGPVLFVPVGGREQEVRLLPMQDAQLSTVLGGLCHVHAENPKLNVVDLFGSLLLIEDEVNVEELLDRLRIEYFLRERLGLKLVEGTTVKAAETIVTERQLSAFLAAATEPQLFLYVRREFVRCLELGARLQIELESERVDIIHSSFLARCFGYESAFGATGLLCIDLQLPTERKACMRALKFLEEDLGMAVAVTVPTVLDALRSLSDMELPDKDGLHRLHRNVLTEPIYVRQLPLLSWLGNHLMTCDAQEYDFNDGRSMRDILFFVPATGDGIRSVTVSSACWYENEQAKWLSDVLDLANLAEVYASARYLFTDVLKVRCTFSVDELCMALDTLSEVVMDGEIRGQELTTSEQDCMADYFEYGLQGLAGRPSVETEMWRSMFDTLPLSGGRTKADIKAFVLGLLLRRDVAQLLAVCTYTYEQLAFSLGDDAAAVDADFFDMRRILVPVAHPARGAFSTAGGDEVSLCRFSTSEDVYWFASTADEAELAAACGLHSLSPHYPNALRRFFVDLLHVSTRPNPSSSRLLEAIHTLAASPPTESTARVVAECERVCPHTSNRLARPVLSDLVLSHRCPLTQWPPNRRVRAQLLSRCDLSGLEEASGSTSTACPRHGPGCHHPACHALGSLFGLRQPGGSAGGGGGVSLSDLGLTATTPRECMERARQSIAQAMSLGRRHGQQGFHRAAECDHAHAEAPTNESAAAD